MDKIKVDDWHWMYNQGWKGEIVDEAFRHPAKFSRGLIRYIYWHTLREGWLKRGDTVLDPFAGVALGALDAMDFGLSWTGVELEADYIDLGRQNIALWNSYYAHKPSWGTATLLQGDSRELARIVGEAAACVSSPPYADGCTHTGGDDPHPEHIKGGTLHGVGISGCISSPPYAETAIAKNSDGIDLEKQYQTYRTQGGGASFEKFCATQKRHSHDYGTTPGQLGAMRGTGFDAAVSSPPYAETPIAAYEGGSMGNAWRETGLTPRQRAGGMLLNEKDDRNQRYIADFWFTARTIIEQVHGVLRPGGVAVWVVKAFVRDGQIVDFPDQWRQMCEVVGFTTLHVHRAWLVEGQNVGQLNMDGTVVDRKVEHKSFFRRLTERKGSPPVDYEVVLCMQRGEP